MKLRLKGVLCGVFWRKDGKTFDGLGHNCHHTGRFELPEWQHIPLSSILSWGV
jgi:hypothetical protein